MTPTTLLSPFQYPMDEPAMPDDSSNVVPFPPRYSWFVLRVISGRERMVVEGLTEQGVTAYRPLHVTWAKFARRVAHRARPLMPGYVFACLPDEHSIFLATDHRAVIEIMCNGLGVPRHIPSMLVGSMIFMEASNAFDETWEPPKVKGRRYAWKKGDRVRITTGPLEGHIVEVLKGRGRDHMEVLLTLFGRSSEIVVPHRRLGKA